MHLHHQLIVVKTKLIQQVDSKLARARCITGWIMELTQSKPTHD